MDITEWITIVATMLILPVILMPLGLLMVKRGRGYNSLSRAGASMEAQNFAARRCGAIMFRISIIMLIFTLACGGLGLAFLENETALTVILVIVIVVPTLLVILPVIFTELAVRRHFDKNGRPYR